MKKYLLLFLMAIIASQAFQAEAQRSQRLTNEDRDKWLIEMRRSKHEFLTKELGLTKEQQNAFFPIYDQMEDELNRINAEVREIERRVLNNDRATDAEIEAAARTIFEQKQKEGMIELQYFDKFKKILKPKQLIKLKEAERKFTRKLVRHGKS